MWLMHSKVKKSFTMRFLFNSDFNISSIISISFNSSQSWVKLIIISHRLKDATLRRNDMMKLTQIYNNNKKRLKNERKQHNQNISNQWCCSVVAASERVNNWGVLSERVHGCRTKQISSKLERRTGKLRPDSPLFI